MDIVKNKIEFDARLQIVKQHFTLVVDDSRFKWTNINAILMLEIRKNWTTESSNSNYQLNSDSVKDFFPILQMTDAFPHWRLSMPAFISNNVLKTFAVPPDEPLWHEAHISYRHKVQNGYPYLQLTLGDDLRLLKNNLKENDQIFFLKEQDTTNYFIFATKSKLFEESSILITDPSKTANDNTQFELSDLQEKVRDLSSEDDSKNIILYGPPGTGKTHNAVNHALAIATKRDLEEIIHIEKANPANRKVIKNEFDELVKSGQIQFVTFHQSYSYEDFVEGIKPRVIGNNIEYNIEDGIFKKLCLTATEVVSYDFEDIYDDFTNDLIKVKEINLKTAVQKKAFIIRLNESGDVYAITSKGKHVGISESAVFNYFKNGEIPLWHDGSYVRAIGDYLKEKYSAKIKSIDNSSKNFVLIIDEINRGNISKIFGELITLIESSKRIGRKEELRIKLSYSGTKDKEMFGVPNNVYIIGTMNSADRSIALIDTALRRRFTFTEYTSDPSTLSDNIEGINLKLMLQKLNERIEFLLDKDHLLGHAYFIDVKTKNDLCGVFRNKILPLLEEYFFGNFEKIQQVLGDNSGWKKTEIQKLVQEKKANTPTALFGNTEDFEDKIIYQINPTLVEGKFEDITTDVFTSIYTKQ
jgi:Cdc6-like AAA superfamily ATPase